MSYELLNFTDSSVVDPYVKVLLYGASGVGKTRFMASAKDAIFICAEPGTLSIRDKKQPIVTIRTHEALLQCVAWMEDVGRKNFKLCALDSLSEIAEAILDDVLPKHKDPRQAYGETQEIVMSAVKSFRDIKMDVVMSCKQHHYVNDADGSSLFGPMMPGRQMGMRLPYLFDEVFAMRVDGDGKARREYVQTYADFSYSAKDRSGRLAEQEKPDLAAILKKIKGQK